MEVASPHFERADDPFVGSHGLVEPLSEQGTLVGGVRKDDSPAPPFIREVDEDAFAALGWHEKIQLSLKGAQMH